MPPYLPKPALAARYGCNKRTIERMWKDGRLPPPDFPLGPQKPYGDLEKIEANERAAAKRPVPRTFDNLTKPAA
jgi:hypothetical protein